MKYTIVIDQKKSIDWGLNQSQASLISILIQAICWANEIIIDGKTYYHCARQMVIKEIPLCYSKPDSVYRAYCTLKKKGLIDYEKFGNKDLIRITDKGKTWNNADLSEYSEINPSKLGNKSESSSEINPTDQYTNTDQYTKDHNIFSFKNSLIDLGIEKGIVEDWLKVRAKKKAANTKTAFKAIKKQIELSSIPANECIKIAAENNWSGFKAEWLNNNNQFGAPAPGKNKLRYQ